MLVVSEFQSTHPSGVRPSRHHARYWVQCISIHAPQWGATLSVPSHAGSAPRFQSTHPSGVRRRYRSRSQRFTLFQSTHPSGVRRDASPTLTRHMTYFNPRTPVGCDVCAPRSRFVSRISIHAPQWGATSPSSRVTLRTSNFNPRTPVGCDGGYWRVHMDNDLFQSTHPSGVRPYLAIICVALIVISIHAPQWGATLRCSLSSVSYPFQSTHPSGVRQK